MKKNIIFICNGNIHRSVIAAESLRKILKELKMETEYSVDSYGIQGTMGTDLPKHNHLSEYPKEWRAAKLTLQKLNIDISGHSFQMISEAVVQKANVVIAMDDKVYSDAKNSLLNQFSNYVDKIHNFSEITENHLGIDDPAGKGSGDVHRNVIKKIYFTIKKNVETILEWTNV